MLRTKLTALRLYAFCTHNLHTLPVQRPNTPYTPDMHYIRPIAVYGTPPAGDLFYRTSGQANDFLMHLYVILIHFWEWNGFPGAKNMFLAWFRSRHKKNFLTHLQHPFQYPRVLKFQHPPPVEISTPPYFQQGGVEISTGGCWRGCWRCVRIFFYVGTEITPKTCF